MTRRSTPSAATTPRGITLVETLVIMSVTAVLSGIVVTGMAAIYRYNHSVTNHFVGQTALQQMAATLRGDIHQATSCQWNPDSQTLRLNLPARQTLEYRKVKRRWVRTITARNTEPVTTSYGLDDSFRCECQAGLFDQGAPIRLTLINKPLNLPKENAQTERTLQCEIVAVVGRDYSPLHN